MNITCFGEPPGLVHGGAAFKGTRIKPGMSHPLRSFQAGRQDQEFTQDAQAALVSDARDGSDELKR